METHKCQSNTINTSAFQEDYQKKEYSCFAFPAHPMFTLLVYSRTQVQPQLILDPDYLPDYLSVSHDMIKARRGIRNIWIYTSLKHTCVGIR